MSFQYNHILFIYDKPEATKDPITGNFVKSTGDGWLELGECREESSEGKKITTDGVVYDYSGIIYLPKPFTPIPKGTKVKVLDQNGNTRLEGNIIYCKEGLFNWRIWV